MGKRQRCLLPCVVAALLIASASWEAHAGRRAPARRAVSGQVIETSDYCGGAAPAEEMLEALRKGKPAAHKKLFLRAGTVNKFSQPILLEVLTDAAGHFQVLLPPGEYCVIEEGKKDQVTIPRFQGREAQSQAACLEKWASACDHVLRVGKQDLKNVVIRFHRTCNPPCTPPGPPLP